MPLALRTNRSAQAFSRRLLYAATALSLVQPASAWAQSAPSTAASVNHNFAIPVQPLEAALRAYMQQSGVQVGYESGDVTGRTSAAVNGAIGASEALSRLLTGTGLTYRFTAPTAVRLEPAPTAEAGTVQLGPVRVEGSGGIAGYLVNQRAAENPTAHIKGYVANKSISANKTNTPILETPQTISVITRDQMDAQQAFSLRQTLRFAPGVYFGDNTDDRIESFNARGFALDEYLDGLKLLTQGAFIESKVDAFFLERIEVLEGPSSALYGQSSPAGLVNMISKHPTADAVHEAQLRFGDRGFYQGALDLGGPLTSDGTLQYRLTGLARDTGTQVDKMRERRFAVAPSIAWHPDDATTFTVLASYIDDPKAGFWSSLPYQGTLLADSKLPGGHIPTSINTGQPDFEHYKRSRLSIGTEFEHRFNDHLKFSQNIRYTHLTSDYNSLQADLMHTDDHTINRNTYMYRGRAKTFAIDNRMEGDFDTGPLHHTVLAGLDYQYTNRLDFSRYGLGPTLDLLAPDYHQVIPIPNINLNRRQKIDQTGTYLQDQIKIGRLVATLAGRYDWASTKTGDYRTNNTAFQNAGAFTGRAGLSYVTPIGIAPYVSYATSFQPTAGTAFGGTPFEPTKGKQYEGGIKYQPIGFNALFTASAFQLTQTNVLTADPVNRNFQVQTGEICTRGIELSAVASITPSFDIRASYTHLAPKVAHDNSGLQGKQPPNTPRNIASLWADYTVRSGPLHGFGLGGGGRYLGRQYANTTNANVIPGATVYDLSIHYDLDAVPPRLAGWVLALNATNLTDKLYVTDCSNLFCRWGQRRAVVGSIDYKW